jgi:hypothetical protein
MEGRASQALALLKIVIISLTADAWVGMKERRQNKFNIQKAFGKNKNVEVIEWEI